MSNKPSFDSVSESNPDKPSLVERTRTTNEAGGEAYEPFTGEFGLYKVVMNQLLEDTYYDDADESFDKVWNRFDEVADTNPEFVLQLATYARQEEGFRDISQLLLVLSANDPRTQEFVRDYAPAIIDRTDEFNSVLSYQIRGYGLPVPKPLKKGITDALHKKYGLFDVDGETVRETWIEGRGTTDSAGEVEIKLLTERGADSVEVVDEGYVHDEYTFSKYSERDKEVSLHDVLNLVRPKPRSEERNQIFGSIAKGELSSGQAEKDHWDVGPNYAPEEIEALREDRTWESTMSDDEDDRSEYEKWHDRLEDMGLMARVRNLRNMREAGISGNHIFDYDVVGVGDDGTGGVVFGENSEAVVRQHQMFPFRFYQAFRACGDVGVSRTGSIGSRTKQFDIGRGDLLDSFSEEWLNSAIDVASENLPETLSGAGDRGGTFTAVDLSGSMDSEISGHSEMARAEIASLFGSMLMKRDSDVGAFGDDFATISADESARATTPTLDIAQRIYAVGDEVGNSTNAHKALDWATSEGVKYDRFVVFTDEQIWDSTRGLFGNNSNRTLKDAWDDYTDQVNPDAHLYVIDLASYGSLSVPQGYENVHQISGWSDSLIEFIDKFEQADDVVSEIESIEATDY